MSSDAIISVNGISKAFQLYNQPNDRLKQFILPRLQKAAGMTSKNYYSDFWALDNISFNLSKGETMGIIGRNGSGKSTLLQIICGTLSPTIGNVSVNGRVAALLELGSGFNPEFSGRDNVYLNATILGLKRAEIDQRYNDIIEFADIGQFISQPVKTYSSGMLVRLAFAVVAHVDADILIVDEALAVGDAVFTQKCMRWLRNFQKTGTVLFVSHDVTAVRSLCNKAVWIHEGVCRDIGDAKTVCDKYLQFTQEEIAGDAIKFETIEPEVVKPVETEISKIDRHTQYNLLNNMESSTGWRTGHAELMSVTLTKAQDPESQQFQGGEIVELEMVAKALQPLSSPILGWFVKDKLGQLLFGEHTYTHSDPLPLEANDVIRARFRFSLPLLPDGDYALTASIADGDPTIHTQHHYLHDCIIINVACDKLRYGLVGIPYSHVSLKKVPNNEQ